jgi:large subunit ribosomal protein L24
MSKTSFSKPKLRIRKDDTVVVITGKNKGRIGKVLRVLPAENRVVVEGVAIVKRHVKKQGDQPGRIIEREAAIHASNVALYINNHRCKVAYRAEGDTKVRVDRKTGEKV